MWQRDGGKFISTFDIYIYRTSNKQGSNAERYWHVTVASVDTPECNYLFLDVISL